MFTCLFFAFIGLYASLLKKYDLFVLKNILLIFSFYILLIYRFSADFFFNFSYLSRFLNYTNFKYILNVK